MNFGVRRLLLRFSRFIALMTLVATIAGSLSGLGLIFELLCHFRVQYLLLAVFTVAVFCGFRRWGWLSLSLLVAVVNGVTVLPWYLSGHQPADGKTSITLLQSNLYAGNRDLSKLLSLVEAERPDLLSVQELNAVGAAELQALSSRLPYKFTLPRGDNFGIGLYSKWPVIDREILRFGSMNVPALRARIDVDGQLIEVIVVHPPPPIGDELYRERNNYMQELARYVVGLSGSAIVVGDLNSSMWSDHYRALEKSAGLRNARAGFGVLPTWPAGLAPVRIPLDHCLISPDLSIAELGVGPDIGSDHLPLIVRLTFTGVEQ